MADLQRRAGLATEAGLPARVLDAAQAVALRAGAGRPARLCRRCSVPADGTARAATITAAFARRAVSAGARFVRAATVTAIDTRGGRIRAVRCRDGETYATDDVMLACGIWGQPWLAWPVRSCR